MTLDQIYAGSRIDYMNARRALKPASGGKSYTADRIANPADARAKLVGISDIDLIREKLAVLFAEQRRIVKEFRNSLAAGLSVTDEIPF